MEGVTRVTGGAIVLSPTMTLVVLAVLWLIVVVPMVIRRNDERRRERSVDRFGSAMRALGRRTRHDEELAPARPAKAEVFRPLDRRLAPPTRRPVSAVQEALMSRADHADLSEARAAMMARRRRSLTVLAGGSVVFTLLAFVIGGLLWLLSLLCLVGLAGYLYFLRTQALHDRDRREIRERRQVARVSHGYDATEEPERFDEAPDTIVRIDDDDIQLHSMDTIDLTGLYEEAQAAAESSTVQRRAS